MANRKKTGIFILSLLLCVVLAACSLLPSGTASNKGPARTDGRLQIYYLDVGQADCELIRFPDGKKCFNRCRQDQYRGGAGGIFAGHGG